MNIARVVLAKNDTFETLICVQRKVPFVEGEYYHLYNRGVDKRTIFATAGEYKRFLMLLYLANSSKDVRIDNLLKIGRREDIFSFDRGEAIVAIGAFCLMPNHFHILATPLVENGISRFMLKLQTGYSMYFNTKNERSGSLFQGPFKSKHAADDLYLKYLFSYIHLNPAKLKDPMWKERGRQVLNGLGPYIEKYPYSSFPEYRTGVYTITNPTTFPNYFRTQKDIDAHVKDWLESKDSWL